MKAKVMLPVILSSVVLSSCAGDLHREGSALDLKGNWRIEDLDQRGIIDSSHLNITFDEKQSISGSAGCNRFMGGYTFDGTSLSINKTATTRMACAPALMEQEQRLLQTFAEVLRVEATDDGALKLTGPSPHSLLLRKENALH